MSESIRYSISFPKSHDGDLEIAKTRDFLGGQLKMALNASAMAELSFFVPRDEKGILSSKGAPPTEVEISSESGDMLFRGLCINTSFEATPTQKRVTLVYQDPIYWLSQRVIPIALASGKLSDLLKKLMEGTQLEIEVAQEVDEELPAQGGYHASILATMGNLCELVGAYFRYSPSENRIRISSWNRTSSTSIPAEDVISFREMASNVTGALQNLEIATRKRLQQGSDASQVGSDSASLKPGDMGSRLSAWAADMSEKAQLKLYLEGKLPSHAESRYQNRVSAMLLRSSPVQAEIRNALVFPGQTIKLTDPSNEKVSEVLVMQSLYDLNSPKLHPTIQGGRA